MTKLPGKSPPFATPRRTFLARAGRAGVAALAALSGARRLTARATTTWTLSVPRSDYINTNWHSANNKYLDLDDSGGTACHIKIDTGASTYGKASFATPVPDCGAEPGDRKKVQFTLWTDTESQLGTGWAQHITAATWSAGVRYGCPVTVGYISSDGEVEAGCWTGSHIHFGCDGSKSGDYPDSYWHETWVDYSSAVGDGTYPWYYAV